LTEKRIQEQEDRSRNKGIVNYLVLHGWVRVRKNGNRWNIQVSSEQSLQQRSITVLIPYWAEKYLTAGEHFSIQDCDGMGVIEAVKNQ